MRRIPVLVVLLLVIVLAGSVTADRRPLATAQQSTPGAPELEATAQRFYDAFNTGDVESLDEVLASDWADFPPPAGPGTDAEDVRETILGFRAAFPDLRIETQDMITEGDQVAVRSILTGTHDGTFLGVAGTGLPVEIQLIDIHRFADGLIVESYHVEDLIGALIQVGAFPPSASPAGSTPAA